MKEAAREMKYESANDGGRRGGKIRKNSAMRHPFLYILQESLDGERPARGPRLATEGNMSDDNRWLAHCDGTETMSYLIACDI